MINYGLEIAEGTGITNLTLPTGTVDPTVAPNIGELFYRTDTNAVRVHNGVSWSSLGGSGITDIVEDLSPQLGANLDTNSFDIVGSEVDIIPSLNGSVNITTTGTGTISTTSATSINLSSPFVDIKATSTSLGGSIRYLEGSTNGTNYTELKAPDSITTNRVWVLPNDDPATSGGKVLSTDTSGILSFIDASGGPSNARLYFAIAV